MSNVRGAVAIQVLLTTGSDANVVAASGDTPLHVASAAGVLANVEALLNGGADARVRVSADAIWQAARSARSPGADCHADQ